MEPQEEKKKKKVKYSFYEDDPGQDYVQETEGGNKVPFLKLLSYSDGLDKFLLIVGALAAAGNGALMPSFSFILGDVIDSMTENPDNVYDAVTDVALRFLYLGIGAMVVNYIQNAWFNTAAERQISRLRQAYLRAMLRQDMGWFDINGTASLTTRISQDPVVIQEGIGDKLGQGIQYFTTFVFGFTLGFVEGWKLTLVILSITPLLAISGGFMMKMMSELSNKGQKAYAGAGAIATEVISSMRTVASFTGEPREVVRYGVGLKGAMKVGDKKAIVTGLGMGITMFIFFGSYGLAFWYGGQLIINDGYTGGEVLTVFFSVVIGAFALGQAGPAMEATSKAQGAAYKMFETIERTPPIDAFSEEGEKPSDVVGELSFKNVHFKYPSRPKDQIFAGLNLDIKAGKTVALVGPSGSGKSSVVSLIQRFYDPNMGIVTLDGRDIKDLNIKWLRQQIGLVSQEPVLFAGTISENIAYGKPGASQDEIEAAAKLANAHNFITQFPDRYNTQVGEKGTQLSGGQKQRIAIARALIKNPKIMLLDEATSALDTESEKIVQEALESAMKGRTTVVIAHRLTTVRDADLIVVLQKGVVVETGTHEQLIKLQGVYTELVHAQQGSHRESDSERESDSDGDNHHSSVSKGKNKLNSSASAPKSKEDPKLGVAVDETSSSKGEESTEAIYEVSLWRLARINSPELPYFLLGCLCAAVNGASNPVFSIIFSEMLDVFYKGEDEINDESKLWAVLFVVIGVAMLLANLGQSSMFGMAGERLTMRLRRMLFQAIIRHNIGWFDHPDNSTGALTARLATDATLVEGLVGTRLGLTVQNLVTIITGIVIAFVYQWKLTLVLLAVSPAMMFANFMEMYIAKGFQHRRQRATRMANTVAGDSLSSIRTVAAFTNENQVMELYRQKLEGPTRVGIKSSQISGGLFGIGQMLMFASYTLAFWYGAQLLRDNETDFLGVMTVFMAVVMSAMSVGQAASFAPNSTKAKAAASAIFKIVDDVPPIDSSSDAGETYDTVKGDVEFRDVSFTYPQRQEAPVFTGLNLKIKHGTVVALVGPSGSGKSTCIQLLERFYDPDAGEVLLDGHDIKSLNIRWMRQQIGLVSQEPVLFVGTIAENIAYGKPGASQEEIEAAARMANAHNFIMGFPDKYQTQVGERGAQMSGGQKQRIAIARAIIKNPKILLLDEATSALDTESEKVVQEALDTAMKGRTTIIVAHRLSTIRGADQIAVVNKGKIAELGTHQSLMDLGGIYFNLVQRQTQQ